jgi:putative SbcD/Mre11-related phosphoesterase
MTNAGLLQGPNGWMLAPEGAAVVPDQRTAVVADLHLGYEWSRGRKGDQLPAHSLREVLERLGRLLARVEITRLVVAGDLVESPKPCARTAADVRSLRQWLVEQGVTLVALPGNHDPRPSRGTALSLELNGWTVAHGDRPIKATRTVTGHEHPIFRAGGISSRCILISPEALILPAFSENAAGLNVADEPIPARWKGRSLRCLVEADDELLDFGEIDSLADRLSGRSGFPVRNAAAISG